METAALLRKAIKSGALPGNSRLDSVTGLAREFHTSRKVIENALKLLKEEGLIFSRPRQGLYVVPTENDTVLVVTSMSSRIPETAQGTLLELLTKTDGRKFEFIESELLRHAPADLFKNSFRKYSCVLLFNQSYCGKEPELERLRSLNIPVLQPFATPEDGAATGFHALYSDAVCGSKTLLQHLKDQGCRRIGFIGWHDVHKRHLFRLPQEKYIELLDELGLEKPERMFGTIHRDNFPGDSSLNEFMENWQRFDALVCYSHLSALHLYAWCKSHNVRIPEDLMVGACGIKLHSELLDPPLTAFHVDGERHHKEVLNFLQGKFPVNENVNMAISPILKIHASTKGKLQ